MLQTLIEKEETNVWFSNGAAPHLHPSFSQRGQRRAQTPSPQSPSDDGEFVICYFTQLEDIWSSNLVLLRH